MKTLVVYYSLEGNSKYIAENIKSYDEGNITLLELIPVKKYPTGAVSKFFWGGKSAMMGEKPELESYSVNLSEYDRVIFGFPVWAARFTPPLRTFIDENRDALEGKKISAYACMAGSGGDKALSKLKEELGISEFEEQMILINPKEKYNEENNKKIEEFCEKLFA
ncbi:flavodoxin domain-containing protein [Eubacterium sp.]|uniref:flavodoxin family protein n=1 Tax=Eubacterium sp. TaxID=142586 RepID=UPI0025D0284F|nr:flavodoxin domain-containing protein [Eubacterium sp.]MCR5629514.1 NAD(P)H-dependent oxidoreductase [Eubacterium sp.]